MKHRNHNNLPIISPPCKRLEERILDLQATQEQVVMEPESKGEGYE